MRDDGVVAGVLHADVVVAAREGDLQRRARADAAVVVGAQRDGVAERIEERELGVGAGGAVGAAGVEGLEPHHGEQRLELEGEAVLVADDGDRAADGAAAREADGVHAARQRVGLALGLVGLELAARLDLAVGRAAVAALGVAVVALLAGEEDAVAADRAALALLARPVLAGVARLHGAGRVAAVTGQEVGVVAALGRDHVAVAADAGALRRLASLQLKKGSRVQVASQPSPEAWLPSSHSSPGPIAPSPQWIKQTLGSSTQVKP